MGVFSKPPEKGERDGKNWSVAAKSPMLTNVLALMKRGLRNRVVRKRRNQRCGLLLFFKFTCVRRD